MMIDTDAIGALTRDFHFRHPDCKVSWEIRGHGYEILGQWYFDDSLVITINIGDAYRAREIPLEQFKEMNLPKGDIINYALEDAYKRLKQWIKEKGYNDNL